MPHSKTLTAFGVLCAFVVVGTWLSASTMQGGGGQTLNVDVACNATTFSFQGPAHEGGGPDHGASFVVHGYIYPSGTFDAHGVNSGVNADGSPEFPDDLIGEWTCRGWFINDGIETATGPFVVTTQIYDLSKTQPGQQTIVSEGLELIDLNTPFRRAISGGTGQFMDASGEVVQIGVGVNLTGLFNFKFNIKL